MAVPWILGLLHPELYEVAIRAANLEQISEHGLFLLLGAFTAIFGTHTINTLRTEAYEAQLLEPVPPGARSSAAAGWVRSTWPSISCSSGPAPSS